MNKESEEKRGPGRPKGAKNIKGCKYPWTKNVVRYSCDVLPAVLDILWRRGSLRLSDIMQSLCFESPHESRWFKGVQLEASAVAKIITEAVGRGMLDAEYGGNHGLNEIIRYRATTERTGWYWLGSLISGNALAQHAQIAPKNMRARLEEGWDVDAARTVESGKGASKKRINTYHAV